MKRIDIADLVTWAITVEHADTYCDLLKQSKSRMVSSTSIACDTLALGRLVDVQGGYLKGMGAKCHPDAVTVWQSMKTFDRDQQSLLLSSARTASPPEWNLWPELQIIRHPKNGKPVVESEYDSAGKVVAQWCPLLLRPSFDLVEAARLRYAVWWQALSSMRDRLAMALTDHIPTGPAAPARPWENP